MSKPDYRAQAICIMTSPYGLETVESLLLAHDLHLTVLPDLRAVADAARALHAVLGSDEDPERAALGAALDALDGGTDVQK